MKLQNILNSKQDLSQKSISCIFFLFFNYAITNLCETRFRVLMQKCIKGVLIIIGNNLQGQMKEIKYKSFHKYLTRFIYIYVFVFLINVIWFIILGMYYVVFIYIKLFASLYRYPYRERMLKIG